MADRVWKGNEFLAIINYITHKGERLAHLIASTRIPEVRLIDFYIPKDTLKFLPPGEEPTGEHVIPRITHTRYQITERNNDIQQFYIDEFLVYDRDHHQLKKTLTKSPQELYADLQAYSSSTTTSHSLSAPRNG